MKLQEGYLTTKSGAWIGHFSRWILDYRTGQKIRKQHAFKIGAVEQFSKVQARERLRERMVQELHITGDGRVTVEWFVENHWKPFREGSWRDSTKQTNVELLKIITDRFGSKAIEEMNSTEMQVWLNLIAKERSGSAVKHVRIFLMSILREATEQDFLRKNPARVLRVPKVKRSDRTFLSLAQVKALLKASRMFARERALLHLIMVTALRPSELFALRWRCLGIKKGQGTITITETVYRGKLRPFTKTTEEGAVEFVTLHVPELAMDELTRWHSETEQKSPDDFIFANSEGGFITKENYQRRTLTPLGEFAGIKRLNFQILRRTVATHAQELGTPKDISTIMRHRKTETAQLNYIQVVEESVKATTEKLAGKLLSQ